MLLKLKKIVIKFYKPGQKTHSEDIPTRVLQLPKVVIHLKYQPL